MCHVLKKRLFFICFLSVSLLSTVLINVFPGQIHHTAFAAGLLALLKNEGPAGTQVNFTGSGFIANATIRLYFSADAAVAGNALDTQVNTYELLGETQTDSQGSLGQFGAFLVPSVMDDGRTDKNVITGDYYIYATYSGYKSIQSRASFFVTGPVTLSPSKGRIGDYTLINGSNYKTNDIIFIYFSSNKAAIGATIDTQVTTYQSAGTAVASPDGTLGSGVSFQIPSRLTEGTYQEDVHGGDYYFYFTYGANRKRIETFSRFTVLDGEIKPEPSHGPVGSEISISGNGLRPNQNITVKYDNELLAISGGDTATNNAGIFNCKVVIPESTTGSHQLIVNDVTGNHPEAWFDIEPSIHISNPVTAGSEAAINGYGFSEIQDVILRIAGQNTSTNPAVLSTNYNGSFKGTFRAPTATGTVTVTATDKQNIKAELDITVAAAPKAEAVLSLYPANSQANPGAAGKPVTVSGAGFNPNSPLTLTYENTPPATFTGIQTNAEGSFQYSFEVPGGAAGEHKIDVTDGTNAASIMFVLESTAPPPPIAEIPEVVSGVKPTTRFDWTDVVDDSGVKYTFQVSPDTTFAQVVLEKSGLTVSEYTMKENERLDLKGRQTAYYWRVAAVDGAGNESTWSNAILFYVGSAKSAFPVWAYYLLGGLGAIIVIVVAAWIIRVKRNQGKTV